MEHLFVGVLIPQGRLVSVEIRFINKCSVLYRLWAQILFFPRCSMQRNFKRPLESVAATKPGTSHRQYEVTELTRRVCGHHSTPLNKALDVASKVK